MLVTSSTTRYTLCELHYVQCMYTVELLQSRHSWDRRGVLISGVLDYTKWVFRTATCQGVLKIQDDQNKELHCEMEAIPQNGMERSGMVGLEVAASTQRQLAEYMVYSLTSSSSLV